MILGIRRQKPLDYSQKPSNSKAQSVFSLTTRYSKQFFFFQGRKMFKVGKGKRSKRQKNIHITNRNLLLNFQF